MNTSSLPTFKSNFSSSGIIPSRLLNDITRTLSNVTGENGIRVSSDFGRGLRIIGTGAAAATTYLKPFDLADLTEDSFSVMNNGAKSGGVWLAGNKVTTIGVSGITFDTDRWESGTISANEYVWLEIDRSAATVTIYMGTTLPDGSAAKYDYVEIHPLWYVPWSSGASAIDTANIIDFRSAIRLPGLA